MLAKILSFNRVVLVLIVVEFFLNSALGTIAPFFAIYIDGAKAQIIGGSATVVGFATAIYWVVKSIFQLPVARWLDRTDGEQDEFWALYFGYTAAAFVPIMYYFSTTPWHIYAAQAFFGFAMAWAVPSFYSIFTRHVDRMSISFEWSLLSVFSVGISSAFAAAIGGWLVDIYGFRLIFLIAGVIMFISSIGVLLIKRHLVPSSPPPKPEIKKKRLKHYYHDKHPLHK